MMADGTYSTQLIVPFFKNFRPELVFHSLLRRPLSLAAGFLPFLIFVVLVMVGSSNAVNLTDGLDGLAIGCVVVAAGALTVLTYVTSHAGFSAYLDIQHLPEVGELTIFCGALVGASLAFLWYNAHPAEVFMGDVGSLALGGSIGVDRRGHQAGDFAVFRGRRFRARGAVGDFAGGFVPADRASASSAWRRCTIISNWPAGARSKIIVRFWIVALVFALFSLTTLKLR